MLQSNKIASLQLFLGKEKTNYYIAQNEKMKKDNINEIKPDRLLLAQKRDYFLGNVLLHDISKKIEAKDQKVYFVEFKNGARTKLHYHEGGQALFVTGGKGILELYTKHSSGYGKVKIRLNSKSTGMRSEEHTSELQSLTNLVCRLLLEKKKKKITKTNKYHKITKKT